MVLGVGVEAAKQIGRGGLLEFDGGDESEDIVPVFPDEFGVDVAVRGYQAKRCIFAR